ncbi:MAG: uL15 family ribosomal protein [Nitrososphaerales archaeon]
MATRLRKVRRFRGSRTHGWGQIAGHRAAGHKGGHGNAGLHKHHWTRTVLLDERHFGRPGFHNPTTKVTKKWVNVGDVDDLFVKYGKVEEGKNVLDLISLGYDKLLGAGKVFNKYSIAINSFAKNAKAKVEGAGGEVLAR